MAEVIDERVLESAGSETPATTTATATPTKEQQQTTKGKAAQAGKKNRKKGQKQTHQTQKQKQKQARKAKRNTNSKQDGGDMMEVDEDGQPTAKKAAFAPVSAQDAYTGAETRSIDVPPHRYTPLKENWNKIFQPVVEHMKLQIRMNVRKRRVELRTCELTERDNALQKAHDFVKAFMLGFDVADAVALLRLDDLYLDTFDVTDVRRVAGDHLSRAIGRVAGKGGKTKFTIENATKTRIVVADSRVHILGAFDNIREARHIISKLIIGSPPSKIYATLQSVTQRLSGRF
ncbi:RNA-binding protein PNO1 [Salpingoeca rosetta]|uniref:RNA-binding protein PNO1 n=1 Tax=Salpingoeca rosetta (strain ATCC 50818 / BSB-021) TaxID=946362 RepID=F2U8H9_SALR5|nr:RNA-binding protein PNO1 [Salpingoeca rosetta]EGD72687.1 RNA-binding protein PNO1 [Salpingoeca rosetta]|eukprot:XP_004994510.1 RNA-binding protein PNO1 [Salpingoeca rosetta]